MASVMNDESFGSVYEPLNGSSEIRLIILDCSTARRRVSSDISDLQPQIRCRMINTKLGNTPYQALSYTWGSALQTRSILINGHTFGIGENLWYALNGLRFHTPKTATEIHLWVDAICINQSDIPERNQQVAIMSRIYMQAAEVSIWLGPGNENTDTAMTILATFSDSDPPKRKDQEYTFRDDYWSQFRTPPFEALFNCEYFSRMWIIQEVVLAPQPTVYCGKRSLPWERFDALFQASDGDGQTGIGSPLAYNLYTSRKRHRKNNDFLVALLTFHRRSRCLDPRDKVFALLGMAVDCQAGHQGAEYISADYSKDLATVYHDVITYWSFQERKNRNELNMAQYSQLLQESFGQPFTLAENVESPLIPVSGYKLCTVSRLGPIFSLEECCEMDRERCKAVPSILSWCPELSKYLSKIHQIPSQERTFWYAFYPEQYDRIPPHWKVLLNNAWTHLSGFFSWINQRIWKQSSTISPLDYRFFDLLDEGGDIHMGIGPTNLSQGDTITQFYDSTLAVAIRPQRFGKGRLSSIIGSVALIHHSAWDGKRNAEGDWDISNREKQALKDAKTAVEWACKVGRPVQGRQGNLVSRWNQPIAVTLYIGLGMLQRLTRFDG